MRLSADDVLDIPVPPHLRGYELVDGKLVEVSLVTLAHGIIAVEVAYRIRGHVRQRGIRGRVSAEAGYVLGLPRDPERLRGPDVSFLSDETLDAAGGIPRRGWFRHVPDLAVEVDSPDRQPEVDPQRIRDYLDAGVRLLWVVDTSTRTAMVYRSDGSARFLREGDALDGEDILPGFTLPLIDLFRTPDDRNPEVP